MPDEVKPKTGKYLVRKPFAVHLQKIITEIDPISKKEKKRKHEQSFFSDSNAVIELDHEDALSHMHKLEPMDDAAKALFQQIYDKQSEAAKVRNASVEVGPSSEERIAAAVVKALVTAGVIKLPGKGAAPAA